MGSVTNIRWYIFAHLLCVHMSLWMRVKPCISFILWLQAHEKNRRTLPKQTNTQAGTVDAMKLGAETVICPPFFGFSTDHSSANFGVLGPLFWAHVKLIPFLLFFLLSLLADCSSAFPLFWHWVRDLFRVRSQNIAKSFSDNRIQHEFSALRMGVTRQPF